MLPNPVALLRDVRPLLRFAFFFPLLLVSAAGVRAQSGGGVDITGTGGSHTIQGRIYFPSGHPADTRLTVKLETSGAGDLSVLSDTNGSFRFTSLVAGSYTVVVDGGKDFETVRESVYIDQQKSQVIRDRTPRIFNVIIFLRLKESRREPPARVLNAALAGVPKPALDLYYKALESVRGGDPKKAVERLNAALALYPTFAPALTQLGMQYLKLREADKAEEALRAALKLTPEDYNTLVTYGLVLTDKKDLKGAEEQFRRAMKKNEKLPFAHHYLGLVLLRQRNLDESEKELQQGVTLGLGGEQLGVAHYYLGGIYWARRDYKSAVRELETYLKVSPNLSEAERKNTQATIEELRRKG